MAFIIFFGRHGALSSKLQLQNAETCLKMSEFHQWWSWKKNDLQISCLLIMRSEFFFSPKQDRNWPLHSRHCHWKFENVILFKCYRFLNQNSSAESWMPTYLFCTFFVFALWNNIINCASIPKKPCKGTVSANLLYIKSPKEMCVCTKRNLLMICPSFSSSWHRHSYNYLIRGN